MDCVGTVEELGHGSIMMDGMRINDHKPFKHNQQRSKSEVEGCSMYSHAEYDYHKMYSTR
jgi:hypothetical protein